MSKNLVPTSTMPATVVVPLATELVSAMNLEVAAQALYNFCEALYDGKIIVASGVTMQVGAGGAFTCHGKAIFNGTGANDTEIADADIEDANIDDLTVRIMDVTESIDLGSTAALTAPIGSNVAVLGRSQRRPRVYLADVSSVTIDTSQADEFVLPGAPTAGGGPGNFIVLRTSTAPIPRAGERITLVVPDMFPAGTGGLKYTVEREDGIDICEFYFRGAGWSASISAEFVFDGGVWRLGPNSGRSRDDGAVQYGVFPAAGA